MAKRKKPPTVEPIRDVYSPIQDGANFFLATWAPHVTGERLAAIRALGRTMEMAIFSSQDGADPAVADELWSRLVAAADKASGATEPQRYAFALEQVDRVMRGELQAAMLPALLNLHGNDARFSSLSADAVSGALADAARDKRKGPISVLLALARACGAWPSVTEDMLKMAKRPTKNR